MTKTRPPAVSSAQQWTGQSLARRGKLSSPTGSNIGSTPARQCPKKRRKPDDSPCLSSHVPNH
ncbi:MAG: hypothetical protein ABIG63_03220, partial [Chloroflexota bacterium]